MYVPEIVILVAAKVEAACKKANANGGVRQTGATLLGRCKGCKLEVRARFVDLLTEPKIVAAGNRDNAVSISLFTPCQRQYIEERQTHL